MRQLNHWWILAIVLGVLFVQSDGEASVRGIGGHAGGIRASASTSFRPGAGVTHSVTVAGGRYHAPAAYPGIGASGAAVRTAMRVERRIARRTAAGLVYYVGAPVVAPSAGCSMVMWEGMAVYDCGGVLYVFEDGQYYPIEGY